MMMSMAEVRRFVANIDTVRIEKLLQAKEALTEILANGGNAREEWLFKQIEAELSRRKEALQDRSAE
jgi:hypothetical protein